MGSNLYNDLGIPLDASDEEIRSAYFKAAKRYHPDVNTPEKNTGLFIQIQNAYNILSNPDKRKIYVSNLKSQLAEEPAANLSIVYSLPSLPPIKAPQMLYALLELRSEVNEEPLRRPKAHICIVADCSTSMKGERLNMVKQNVIELLPILKPTDRISMITFSDRAEVILDPTSPAQVDVIEEALKSIKTSGATELSWALKAASEHIERVGSGFELRQIIVLTDGQTYGDEQECLDLAAQIAEYGIQIHALGIGSEWNDAFLDKLTAISGGHAYFVRSPYDFNRILGSKFESFDHIFARSVHMNFEMNPSVRLCSAFRLQPSEGPLQFTEDTLLGDAQYGKTLQILLELMIAPLTDGTESIKLLAGQIWMEIPTRSVRTFRLPILLERPVKVLGDYDSLPLAMIQSVEKLSLYRLQEKARSNVEVGHVDQAVRQLDHLADRLLMTGSLDLARMVRHEADTVRHTQFFSEEGEKRIKYGVRSLFSPPSPETRSL